MNRKRRAYRHSTTFYRKLKKQMTENNIDPSADSEKVLATVTFETTAFKSNPSTSEQSSSSVSPNRDCLGEKLELVEPGKDYFVPENDDLDNQEENSLSSQILLGEKLREWALVHRVSHSSLNDLLHILKSTGGIKNLPSDSRTLLKTASMVNIVLMGNGQFWYNGIKNCLTNTFYNIGETISISLIFNVDGLPPFNSAPKEFWPILFRIQEMPQLKPMVVAFYCGETKPPLEQFSSQFVAELNDILNNGIILDAIMIIVKLKYFVCDIPARSFIKGTVGFNAAHGCIKCTVIGEFDKGGKHMSFPRIDCALRTDESFRNMSDEDHHKTTSPLVKLPMDMVDDVIIADSLHLLDLGIIGKCLYGWVNGSYNFRTKLSWAQIDSLSEVLDDFNKIWPKEIHQAIRRLKCLKFWKGVEYRTFLLYIGPVVLKDYLSAEAYPNFLTLHCAVTILSCKPYLKYIHIADQLLTDYIEQFIDIYGLDAISSNVHNLCHLVNDVRRFGPLPDISSYPFENFLGSLKALLRTGNRPITQLAKRVLELSKLNIPTSVQRPGFILKNEILHQLHQLPSCSRVFRTLHIGNDFILASDKKNKWFMTRSADIVSAINFTYFEEEH